MVSISELRGCCSSEKAYRFLPFRFMRLAGKTLLVNQVGQYLMVGSDDFARFADGRLSPPMISSWTSKPSIF